MFQRYPGFSNMQMRCLMTSPTQHRPNIKLPQMRNISSNWNVPFVLAYSCKVSVQSTIISVDIPPLRNRWSRWRHKVSHLNFPKPNYIWNKMRNWPSKKDEKMRKMINWASEKAILLFSFILKVLLHKIKIGIDYFRVWQCIKSVEISVINICHPMEFYDH